MADCTTEEQLAEIDAACLDGTSEIIWSSTVVHDLVAEIRAAWAERDAVGSEVEL